MEPLASLGATTPLTQLLGAPAAVTSERTSRAEQVPHKERGVELRPDRAEAAEQQTSQRRPSVTDASRSGEGSEQNDVDRRPEAPVAEPIPLPNAKNHGVTYTVYPDLQIKFQGKVVDRDTTETVRSIPTEAHIEQARRYQEYVVGEQLDVFA